MSAEMRQLAAAIIKIQEQLRNSTTTIQLNNSSIEDGVLEIKNSAGNTVMEIGQQWDGSIGATPLTGPEPPTPSTPTANETPGGGVITWDGYFFDAQAMADFARMEVHADPDPMLTGEYAETLRGTIETPRGGEVHLTGLLPGITYYVRLVCRSTSGKRGPASAIASFTPTELTAADTNNVYRQATAPTGDIPEKSIWFNSSDGNAISSYENGEWVRVIAGSSFIADTIAGKKIIGCVVQATGGEEGSDAFVIGTPDREHLKVTSNPSTDFGLNPGAMYILGHFPVEPTAEKPVYFLDSAFTIGGASTALSYFTNPTPQQVADGLHGKITIRTPSPKKLGQPFDAGFAAIELTSNTYAADPDNLANHIRLISNKVICESPNMTVGGEPVETKDTTGAVPVALSNGGNWSTASTSYVYRPEVCCRGTFVAPRSGSVHVAHSALVRTGVAGQATSMAIEVRSGSYTGTIVQPNLGQYQAANYNTQYASVARAFNVTGLTPGTTYYIQQLANIPAGGGIIAQALVSVLPL